jgi:hypothetical protein
MHACAYCPDLAFFMALAWRVVFMYVALVLIQGTAFYLAGAGLVIIGWTVTGVIVEVYGFWLLFCEFLPTVMSYAKRIPFLSRALDVPLLSTVRSGVWKCHKHPAASVLALHMLECSDPARQILLYLWCMHHVGLDGCMLLIQSGNRGIRSELFAPARYPKTPFQALSFSCGRIIELLDQKGFCFI